MFSKPDYARSLRLCSLCLLYSPSQWPCYLCHTFLSYVETGRTSLLLALSQLFILFVLPLSASTQVDGNTKLLWLTGKMWHNENDGKNQTALNGMWVWVSFLRLPIKLRPCNVIVNTEACSPIKTVPRNAPLWVRDYDSHCTCHQGAAYSCWRWKSKLPTWLRRRFAVPV